MQCEIMEYLGPQGREFMEAVWDTYSECHATSFPEIAFLIRAGDAAVPELIPYLDDVRMTDHFYNHPASSSISLEPLMVGEIACYMLEANLRSDAFFTWRCTFLDDIDADDQARVMALCEAAKRYQEWYERNFDATGGRRRDAPHDMPDVWWPYEVAAKPGHYAVERGRN